MQSFPFSHRRGSFCLLLIILFASSICRAQQQKIDSLERVLPALAGAKRIDCLNQISYEYINLDNKDSAHYYNEKAYSEATEESCIHGIAVSFAYKAQMAKHFEDDFAKAEAYGKEALLWFDKTSNKEGLTNAYFYLSYASFSQSKFEEASAYAQKWYAMAMQAGDSTTMLDALGFIFAIKRQSGNYEEAFSIAERRYDLTMRSKNKIQIADALYSMAQLYELVEDYPDALHYFRQVWQMYDREVENNYVATDNDIWLKMEFTEVFAHLGQFDSAWQYYQRYKPDGRKMVYMRVWWVSTGECYLLQKDYPHALQNFQLGLALHRKLNDQNEVMRTLLDLGQTYLAMGENTKALEFGREGLNIALHTKAKRFIRDGFQILYEVDDRLQNTDSANYYFRQYVRMKEEVLNDVAKGKFAAYNYNQHLALVNKEKQVQQAKLEKETFVRKVLIGGIGILFVFSFLVIRNTTVKRKNEKQRLEQQLLLQNAEAERAKAELQQQASELEIRALRAQMNPHFIFNSLNSINRFVLQNDKLQASEYLTKFSKLVRLILNNSQATVISLETELEALTLYLQLEALRFNHHFDYEIKIGKDVDIEAIKLPPLVLQPYVENAIWHGLMHREEKGRLEINLQCEGDMLHCRIIDNGVGRKKASELKSKLTLHKSLGMHITAERLALLHRDKHPSILVNDLSFPDGSAAGTEVILKIPVAYD